MSAAAGSTTQLKGVFTPVQPVVLVSGLGIPIKALYEDTTLLPVPASFTERAHSRGILMAHESSEQTKLSKLVWDVKMTLLGTAS